MRGVSTSPAHHGAPAAAGAPVGVALLGFGFAGQTFHAPFIVTTPGLTLRVVASGQPARVAAAYPDVRAVGSPHEAITQDDVDLVVIATPNDTHAPLAEAALRAGRHVVVDKPFTITLDEARAVVATAEAAGRLVSVFQNRRWDSDFLAVRHALEAGLIGDVVELRSEIARWRPQVRDRWRERPGPGAGLWYDLGPHLVDQAVVLFGPPDTVRATLRTQRPGGQTDDWCHAVLDYPTRQVILSASMLAAEPAPRFVVRGTTGSLVKRGVDQQERHLIAGARPGDGDWGADADPLVLFRDGEDAVSIPAPPGDYGLFYARMRDAIHRGSGVPVSPAEAVTVMAIIAAGRESSDRACAISLRSQVVRRSATRARSTRR
jgi:predicted dehydrogenase